MKVSACFSAFLRPAFGGAGLLAASFSAAQTAVNPAPPTKSGEENLLELSPFVITAEQDTGYAATDSLAGTRLRTPLRDIAASVSVITKDVFDDLGVTDTAGLLVYTAGTEVVGVGGNFSGSNTTTYNQEYEPQRESANTENRIRGLAGGDSTRNFFLGVPHVPMDAYNTQSATINRGANAILFGFGSPAGIIENTLVSPTFKNRAQLQLKYGSYGTFRSSLDVDRVLLKDKLAIRFDILDDNRRYEQEQTFRDQKRYFGAITYRPFKWTTIRVNAEKGDIDQRLPRVDPPVDSIGSWWDFGKLTRTNLYYGKMPDGTAVTTYQLNNNLNGMAGNWGANPGVVYGEPDVASPTDGYVAYATAPGGVVYRHLGPRSSSEVARLVPTRLDPLGTFQISKQITDRSIFDYRKYQLEGPNNGTWLDFNTQNIAIEQLFLDGDAGIELVYDRQKSVQSVLRTESGYRGNNIYIDVDLYTTDGRPNPNFGRPYTAASGYINRDNNLYETARATAYLKHDFRKQWGFFGRLLGVQTVTGLYTEWYRDQVYYSGVNAAAQVGWIAGTGGTTMSDRNISTVVYLGPSLADASSLAGANIQGIRNKLVLPDTVPIWVENSTTGYKWVQQEVPVYQFPDYEHLVTNVSSAHYKATSSAVVLQGNWWDDLLVSTLGWRHDSVRNSSSQNTKLDPTTGAVPLTPLPREAGINAKNDTFSYGLVLHAPKGVMKHVPGATDLSLYYNQSENFQLTGIRRNSLGEYLDPQSGDTNEIGLGLAAFKDRLRVRVAWYETTQNNITDSRISNSSVLNRIAALESAISGNIARTALDAVGYVSPDGPNISSAFASYLAYYGASLGPVRDNGTRVLTYVGNPVGAAELTNSKSKGVELELVYNPTKNWRIMANVYKQEATQGGTSEQFEALLNERLVEWKKIWPDTIGSWTVETYALTNLINPLNTAKLSVGKPNSELRKWRANLITNYSFDRTSPLKGWSIGGGARWQDRVAMGYPVIDDPQLGLVSDIDHPFMGDSATTYDAWISYQRRILKGKVNWKIQLNVRNLLNDNLLIPVVANPVTVGDLNHYDVASWRVGEERTFELTSTFTF
ncbi:hypothetical protein DB347_16915 [Opitutaceae bacterium EW11]|nr:hypothetical protein DB347_16915 [Opitutaceae bacterium EW11]